jgi:hypothetical protein
VQENATVTLSIPTDTITVVAPLPELLSQRNVEATTGVTPATFLGLLRAPGFPLSVTRLGKTRLVDRAAFVSWLRSGAALPTVEAPKPANEVGRAAAMAKRIGVTLQKTRTR